MNGATVSILGMYQYDDTIFDGLILPDGIDKPTVINSILLRCAELQLLYPQAMVLKIAIENWAMKSQYTWTKLLETQTVEYNPIDNYDKYEEWTDTSSGNSSSVGQVAGFNSADFENRDKASSSGNSSATHTGHIRGNIGVTSAMSLISEQRKVVQFNIYDFISDDFASKFCLLVY